LPEIASSLGDTTSECNKLISTNIPSATQFWYKKKISKGAQNIYTGKNGSLSTLKVLLEKL
jgi:hypothetical protein